VRIQTKTQRSKLKPRREPYWHRITVGKFVGYRAGAGTWLARLGKTVHSLGACPTGIEEYTWALQAAESWFRTTESGVDTTYTVGKAIKDYLKHQAVAKGERAAENAEKKLKAVPEALRARPLVGLKKAHIVAWHEGLVKRGDPEIERRSKDTANRKLTALKAVLNYAFHIDRIDTDAAWKSVRAFAGVGKARDLLLTREQVQRFLGATEAGFHQLVKGLVLTGARLGELRAVRVADLDLAQGTLKVSGKTGPRSIVLSSEAMAFFRELSCDRLPQAHLFVRDDGSAWKESGQYPLVQAALKKAKLPTNICLYHIRHYVLSEQVAAGVPVLLVARNAGTSVVMIDRNYGKRTSNSRDLLDRVQLA
jgi:integrase